MGALSKYRILDLSRILAGPWASQLLADLGAEVIKIECPVSGDDTRSWGPPFIDENRGVASAAYFHAINRNKKSIALDISRPEGQNIVRKLVSRSDVLLENFKVGGLKKYGLDYETLREHRPDLIYCSITGFGLDGPYKGLPGYDFMIQAMGGLMSITGEVGGAPMKVGVAMADITTGLYAANAIQAALLHREHSGEGQLIDLSLLDVQVATLANQAMNYLVSGVSPTRMGNTHPNIVPYQAFATRDGHIILAVGNDQQFRAFCELTGNEELAEDPRYAGNKGRVNNREKLVPVLEMIMQKQASAWWLCKLNEHGIPCGPINDLAQVFADPQVQHRKMQLDLPLEDHQTVPSVANPIRMSQSPVNYQHASPALGQHSRECLQQLTELDEAEIDRLVKSGVIA